MMGFYILNVGSERISQSILPILFIAAELYLTTNSQHCDDPSNTTDK